MTGSDWVSSEAEGGRKAARTSSVTRVSLALRPPRVLRAWATAPNQNRAADMPLVRGVATEVLRQSAEGPSTNRWGLELD